MNIYLEIGKQRIFASALDWPGWCRSAKNEGAALQTLLVYGPRYAAVLRLAKLEFQIPESTSAFVITERLEGNATTDFGSPGASPRADEQIITPADTERLKALLQASWQILREMVQKAMGKELRKGPRGGGRETEEIWRHVIEAHQAYLKRLGWEHPVEFSNNPDHDLAAMCQASLSALDCALNKQLPEQGPRGGKFWTPRYYVRRAAWHILDHAWEIEDRSQ